MNINNKFLFKSLLKISLSLMALISFNSSYSKYVNYDEAEKIANQYMDINLSYIPASPVRNGIISNAIVYSGFTFPSIKTENKINFNDEDITYYLATLQNLNAAIKQYVVGNALDVNLTRPNQFYDAADQALLQLLLILDVQSKSYDDNATGNQKIIEDALKSAFDKKTGFFDKDKVIKSIDKALGNKKTTNQLLEEITKRRAPVLAAMTSLADEGSKFATEYAQEPANIKTATVLEKQNIAAKIIQNIAELNKEYLAVRDLINKSKTTEKEKERAESYLSDMKKHIDTLSNLANFDWLKNIVLNFDEINKNLEHEVALLLLSSKTGGYSGFDKAIKSIIDNIKINEVKKEITRQTLDQFTHALLAKDFKKADELFNNFGTPLVNANVDGHTPLTLLIRNSKTDPIEEVKYLINKGVDVNITDGQGFTPLMYSVWRGFVDVTKLLVDAGAKKDVKANNGATALTIAKGQSPMGTLQPDNSSELVKLVS